MGQCCSFLKSTVGRKVVAAVTGLLLFGFVVGHAAGNLKAFFGVGADGVHKLDHYAEMLRTMGEGFLGHGGMLWLVRIGLLGVFVLHVAAVASLRSLNRRARPERYQVAHYTASTPAARAMWYGGLLIFAFVIFHILHFTTGTVHTAGFVHGKVYANVVNAFQSPVVTLVYVIAMVALGLHLFHGVWSLFQTLGLDNADRNQFLRLFARGAACVVVLMFLSVPLAAFLGLLPKP